MGIINMKVETYISDFKFQKLKVKSLKNLINKNHIKLNFKIKTCLKISAFCMYSG